MAQNDFWLELGRHRRYVWETTTIQAITFGSGKIDAVNVTTYSSFSEDQRAVSNPIFLTAVWLDGRTAGLSEDWLTRWLAGRMASWLERGQAIAVIRDSWPRAASFTPSYATTSSVA